MTPVPCTARNQALMITECQSGASFAKNRRASEISSRWWFSCCSQLPVPDEVVQDSWPFSVVGAASAPRWPWAAARVRSALFLVVAASSWLMCPEIRSYIIVYICPSGFLLRPHHRPLLVLKILKSSPCECSMCCTNACNVTGGSTDPEQGQFRCSYGPSIDVLGNSPE